ncbi:TolC family protein [Polaribacter cellanae]|uniref:TolC family protein n=1 Tax=Polaribacter cellanae TaxID=2818493 RepID=A0A975H651_9FLAO|nr:TolC family protein [Polaribacter cellanae]QTE21628.1 TolC family protein [Polaribacter cellanae]
MKTNLILFVVLLTSIATFSQKQWTLKECVDYALENNITIKQNKLNVETSELEVINAKGNFLPNLNGSASQSFNFGSFLGQDGARISRNTRGNGFGLSSSTTLFNGFINLNTYKQAKLGVEGSKLDLEQIENDISLNVVNGYLNILFAKENLNAAKIQAEISEKQIESAEKRFNAGAIAKGELLNTQSTAASDLQNVIATQNALDLALLNLAQILQVPAKNFDIFPIDVGTPSETLLYDAADFIYEKALLNRPEIEKAKLNLEQSDLSIEISKGRFFPTLSFGVGLNTSYQTILGEKDVRLIQQPDGSFITQPNGFFTQLDNNLGYNFGLNLSIPIFNRNQTKVNVSKSKINREISETRLQNEKIQLKQTIEKAYLDTRAAAKSYEAAKISLEAQKEAFKNAQERYNYGAITLFDFDLVRTRLVNAESLMIRSKYDYVFKTKVLQFYSGELVLE